MKQLTKREKLLIAAIAGVVFLLVNLFLLTRFVKNQSQLRQQASQKASELQGIQELCKARESWASKDAWLKEKQPKVSDRGRVGVELLNYIKDKAKQCAAVPENQAIGEYNEASHSVSVDIETKSSWEGLIRFLNSVQQPDQFIVFESANIQMDAADQTQMRGKFKIARWYAEP